MGWSVLLWDGRNPDQVFEEYRPDVYFADVRFRHKVPARVKRGETRVLMTVDQWADEPAFPMLAGQGYVTRLSAVRWVRKLDPQLLYHHSSPKGIEVGWSRWQTREGRRVISLPLAGDPINYKDDGADDALRCDLGFLGQYSRYKAPGLHEYLLEIVGNNKARIFGPGWPRGVAEAERLPDNLRNKFFRSATVQPCIHEPHARLYGVEVTERLFKVPLSGGFTIADPVACIYDEGFFSKDELLMATSGTEMKGMVEHYVANPDERAPLIERARARVLRQHTYFHRLAQVLRELKLPEKAAEVDAHIEAAAKTGQWAQVAGIAV
jgi:hypothetical protein